MPKHGKRRRKRDNPNPDPPSGMMDVEHFVRCAVAERELSDMEAELNEMVRKAESKGHHPQSITGHLHRDHHQFCVLFHNADAPGRTPEDNTIWLMVEVTVDIEKLGIGPDVMNEISDNVERALGIQPRQSFCTRAVSGAACFIKWDVDTMDVTNLMRHRRKLMEWFEDVDGMLFRRASVVDEKVVAQNVPEAVEMSIEAGM